MKPSGCPYKDVCVEELGVAYWMLNCAFGKGKLFWGKSHDLRFKKFKNKS